MLYPYKCPNCGEIEIDKKMSEPELTHCPKCDAEIQRVFTLTGIKWNCGGACGKIHSR
jgi:putative FmdB family regulatory protein